MGAREVRGGSESAKRGGEGERKTTRKKTERHRRDARFRGLVYRQKGVEGNKGEKEGVKRVGDPAEKKKRRWGGKGKVTVCVSGGLG